MMQLQLSLYKRLCLYFLALPLFYIAQNTGKNFLEFLQVINTDITSLDSNAKAL